MLKARLVAAVSALVILVTGGVASAYGNSRSYSSPSYSAPRPAYTPPRPAYTPPRPAYTPPRPAYTAPRPTYTPPPAQRRIEQNHRNDANQNIQRQITADSIKKQTEATARQKRELDRRQLPSRTPQATHR